MQCVLCDYTTTRKYDWKRHLRSASHALKHSHQCICLKSYKSKTALRRHERTCPQRLHFDVENVNVEKIVERLAQEQASRDELLSRQRVDHELQLAKELAERDARHANELASLRAEIAARPTNCTFNLNVFLNETCKEAQTIDQFINGIDLLMDPSLSLGQQFIDTLARCAIEDRPIHCTDTKRCRLAVKNADDSWEQDQTKVDPLIYVKVNALRHRYINKMDEWCRENPTYRTDGKVCDEWHRLFTMISADLDAKFISQVAKSTTIPKDV